MRAALNIGRLTARLARDARGTAMIELGIAAPVIGLLILGVVDIAMGFAAKVAVEQAASRTVERAAIQGPGNAGYDYLRAEAAAASGQPIGNVTLAKWLECNGTRQSAYEGTCAGGQQVQRYVSISISRSFRPLFNYAGLARMYGGQGMGTRVSLTGDAILRVQ